MAARLITLTIGIPAFNEVRNLPNLINQLMSQNYSGIKLENIVVSSDGSTDNTVPACRNLKIDVLKIIANPARQGISRGLNQIVSGTHSDILILLDADISITDPLFVKKLINPILKRQADLTSTKIVELPPANFISRIIWLSQQAKNNIFYNMKNGNNLYTCHGPARAMSNRFYSRITFPKLVGNDMYSYLFCIQNKFTYCFVTDTEVYYKLPQNISDHSKQSTRFFQACELQKQYFPLKMVKQELLIPPAEYVKGFIKSLPLLLKYPVEAVAYLLMPFYFQLKARNMSTISDAWQMSFSSKKL